MKLVFAAFSLLLCAHSVLADRPNLLLIIADDISCDDLGCYGNTFARTPHLDALAANGRRFDQAFLTASKARLSKLLDQWVLETGDDIPANLSKDGFDRETGASLKLGKSFLGTPAGATKNAVLINAPGPR